jgi:hypothetical protein
MRKIQRNQIKKLNHHKTHSMLRAALNTVAIAFFSSTLETWNLTSKKYMINLEYGLIYIQIEFLP